MKFSFATQSYKQDSLPLSAQRCVNAYAEFQPQGSGAKVQVAVKGSPGITTWITVGRGPIRAFISINSVLYVVSRDEFYSVTSAGVALLLGNGITGLAPVVIDATATQIAIANGSLGFIYDIASAVFTQISDGDFHPGATVTSIDQYFVWDWLGTSKFTVSDLLAGTSYNALMFATAESRPDNVLAVRNQGGVLRLLGETTIENWDSTGAGTPPFQRFDGATVSRGLAAALATAEEDSGLFILGNDRVFYRLQGSQPVRVSTHAIEQEWQKYSTVSDAFCFVIQWNGHKFIYVTFPTQGATWAFDIATNLWHERESHDATGLPIRWRANCAIQAFDRVLIGDANSGKIGYLDEAVYTEFGETFITELCSPPISGDGRTVLMSNLQILMQTGVGITTGQGSDPMAMIDISRDGGTTFGVQLFVPMGKKGERETRVTVPSCGQFKDGAVRLRISDPVKRVVYGAVADISVVG